MTLPEYINAASQYWMDRCDKTLFRFCVAVGIDPGKEWFRILAGTRSVTVKVLFRIQTVSKYSLDHLDPRYNFALERLPSLKEWRLSRGLSQGACAAAIGMSVQSFDTMETTHKINRCSFRAEKMIKVADLFAGKIHVEAREKSHDRYAAEGGTPKDSKPWDINTATDTEIKSKVTAVWRYAMFGAKNAFDLTEAERGLYTARSDTIDYIVDVRKSPALFRATLRYAGAVLCERYV